MHVKKIIWIRRQALLHATVILALGKQRQEDEFEGQSEPQKEEM